MVELLSVTECIVSTDAVLILYLLPLIAIFFILMGISFKLGFLGVFGSLMLMVSAWFLSPCFGFFAYVIALLSFVLLVYFVVTNLGFGNDVFSS